MDGARGEFAKALAAWNRSRISATLGSARRRVTLTLCSGVESCRFNKMVAFCHPDWTRPVKYGAAPTEARGDSADQRGRQVCLKDLAVDAECDRGKDCLFASKKRSPVYCGSREFGAIPANVNNEFIRRIVLLGGRG